MNTLKIVLLASAFVLANPSLFAMISPKEEEKENPSPSLRKNPEPSDIEVPPLAIQKKRIPLYDTFEQLVPFGASRYKDVLNGLKTKSVLERFKIIDGPIYEKNKPLSEKLFARKKDFQTSTRSGNFFKSQNIPPPKDRRNNLQDGDTFDPAMALKELKDLQIKYKAEEFTKIKMREGKQGHLIAQILEKTRLDIIRDLNLGIYPPHQQKMILASLEGLEPQELSLRFSPLITLSYLQKLNFKGLRVLDLRGCESINDTLLNDLQEQVPALQELNLSRVRNLRQFAKSEGGGFFQQLVFKSLEFSRLERLSLSGCENLEEIHLKAPSLKHLRANRCGKLKTFDGEASNLAFLSVLGNPELEPKELDEILVNARQFPELRYDVKATNEEKGKVLQAHEIDPGLSIWFLYHFPKITDEVIRQRTKLTTLALGESQIDSRGCKLLGRGLEKNTSLTSLYFWGNCIGDEGAKSLPSLTNLTSLDLRANNIGAEGAKSLTSLTNLTNLNLWNNNIGAEGAKSLISLTNLKSLYLWNNNIGAEGKRVLKQWEKERPELKIFY